jgi:hypothetical protein
VIIACPTPLQKLRRPSRSRSRRSRPTSGSEFVQAYGVLRRHELQRFADHDLELY